MTQADTEGKDVPAGRRFRFTLRNGAAILALGVLLVVGMFALHFWQNWRLRRAVADVGGLLESREFGLLGAMQTDQRGDPRAESTLILDHCDVDEPWLARHRSALQHLPGRLHLELSFTGVTDASATQLSELRHLSFLGLQSTQVTDEGVRRLARIEGLEGLTLNNTAVTDAG